MARIAKGLSALLLMAPLACGGPAPEPAANPLLGPWRLISAPGPGSKSFREVIFSPEAMQGDGRKPTPVRAYQVTRTKVHVMAPDGQVRTYRVVHDDLICEEPPPERIFQNFRDFEDIRPNGEACYQRSRGGARQRPQSVPKS